MIGVFCAPLVIPVVVVVCVLAIPGLPLTVVGQHSWSSRFREGLSLGILATGIGYLVTIGGLLPAHAWLQKQGHSRWRAYATVGAILGILPSLVFAVFVSLADLSLRDYPLSIAAVFMLVGAACGAAAATIFWLIAADAGR